MANWLPKNVNKNIGIGKNNFMDPQMHSQGSSSSTKKCALMNEQQWAQLNEQIKQICLDCSRQFVQQENDENSSGNRLIDSRRTTITKTMPNNGTIYAAQNQENKKIKFKNSDKSSFDNAMPRNSGHLSPECSFGHHIRMYVECAEARALQTMLQNPDLAMRAFHEPSHINQCHEASNSQQTHQLPPTAKKSSGFSLPRLLLPKSKEKQSRTPPNQQQQDLSEQHSPTTTTSAYGTGGTDTGQESPVEKNQQMQQKNSTGLMTFGGSGEQQQQRENVVVKGGRQKSVKFDTLSISFAGGSKNASEDIVQLPGGVFYTSAERLSQTLEAQQRLLRKELQQEEIPSNKMPTKPSHQLQRQQSLDKTKRHIIRVPASPIQAIPMPSPSSESAPILHFPPPSSNSNNLVNRPSPMSNLIMRNPSVDTLSPRPVQKTLLGRPPSLQHVVPPNSPKSTVAKEENVRHEQMLAANFQNNIGNQNNKSTILRGRHMHLKPTLDNIFAYKAATTNTEVSEKEKGKENEKEKQPKIVVIRQFGFGHQPRRKSKSPVKQTAASSQQQSSAELEWVVKRRPDGTRYVTRRPARKQKQQCWSAVVKARREQSLLRERYQSGAVSTTTDDDGAATGSEMAHQVSRLWMREQRRRHKGRTTTALDGAIAIERSKRECLYGDGEDCWAGGMMMEPNNHNNNSDFGAKQQILPRLNTNLRLIEPQQQIGGGRGHSLPGQTIFSITTV